MVPAGFGQDVVLGQGQVVSQPTPARSLEQQVSMLALLSPKAPQRPEPGHRVRQLCPGGFELLDSVGFAPLYGAVSLGPEAGAFRAGPPPDVVGLAAGAGTFATSPLRGLRLAGAQPCPNVGLVMGKTVALALRRKRPVARRVRVAGGRARGWWFSRWPGCVPP